MTQDSLSKMKILIVDDDDEARAMMRTMLKGLGIRKTLEAPDGLEALNFIKAAPAEFDIIVCDWNMPNMNGVEFLRELRLVDPDVPFLMVTGRGDVDSVVEAKSSGVTGYIRKPFLAAELEAKLRIMIHRRGKAA